MLTVDQAWRSLELANRRGLSRSALVRQLLSEALGTDTGTHLDPHDAQLRR
jgi:Ribbon-helix-helix protein, copG family